MTERRATHESLQVLAEDTVPERRATHASAQAIARDTAPERRFTQVVVQVMVEEYDYGWGTALEGAE